MQQPLLDIDLEESDMTLEEIQNSFFPATINYIRVAMVLLLISIFLWFFITHF